MYKLPLDPTRIVRASATVFASQSRVRRRAVVADCDGSGMPMRLGCVGLDGRVSCPICRHRVPAVVAGPKLIHLGRHPAAGQVVVEDAR